MAYRTLELTLISAKDLKKVNLFSKMEVYVVVSLSDDPRSRQRTPPDREGGRNPNWNSTLGLTVPAEGHGHGLVLHIRLRSERLLGDRDVGEVRVPVRELLDAAGDGGPKFLSYQVRRLSSGKAKGVLNFSYKLGEVIPASAYPPPAARPGHGHPVAAYPPEKSSADEPVTAYPVGSSYGGAYPPPGAYPPYGAPPPFPPAHGYPPYGYAAAPQAGYGFPPAGYGYGYEYGAAPPVVQKPLKKNNFGMGMGAGLLGGAIGGLLIGDMISDAGAYDAGFDDGGGFGF